MLGRVVPISLLLIAGLSGVSQGQLAGSVDLGVGGSSGHGGAYTDRSFAEARMAGTLYYWTGARFGLFAEAASQTSVLGANSDLDCLIRPGVPGCAPGFPDLAGRELLVGPAFRFARLTVTAGAGLGEARSSSVRGIATGVDGAVTLFSHFAVTAAAHRIDIAKFQGDHLSADVVYFGFRLK